MTDQDVTLVEYHANNDSISSLDVQKSNMAAGLGTRQAADEEARAEVVVLNSRLEKTRILNAKLAASLQRLQASGSNVQSAMGPLAGNTMELRVVTKNIDAINQAIGRIRQPSESNRNEEEIIRRGPGNGQLSQHLESVQRLVKNLAELQQTKLRSNEKRVGEITQMLKMGNSQLENYFRQLLQAESGMDGLEDYAQNFLFKDKAFPVIRPDTLNQLSPINQHMSAAIPRQNGAYAGSPMIQAYADVRGPYLKALLAGMAFQTAGQKKRRNQDENYKPNENTIGFYTKAMQGAFLAEYQNICELFKREEWSQTFNLTTQGAIAELAQTLRTLDAYIKASLNTECFLAYETMEAVSTMSEYLVERTGELKTPFSAALKPVRETGKSSLKTLLDDMNARVQALQTIPADGAAIPITSETMNRLQSMTNFLGPLSSLMLAVGDGGWKDSATKSSQGPNLDSFDVSADGIQIFINYCFDTIAKLTEGLNNRALMLAKNKSVFGVFILNNFSVIERMIKGSELKPLLESSPRIKEFDTPKKRATDVYCKPWVECSKVLLDSVNTNRGGGGRPTSGSASAVDSTLILKGMNGKEREVIKDKFKAFNEAFTKLVAENKLLTMEKDVKIVLAKEARGTIEVLYGRFYERYFEIDKGRGKYIKFDKNAMAAIFMEMGA